MNPAARWVSIRSRGGLPRFQFIAISAMPSPRCTFNVNGACALLPVTWKWAFIGMLSAAAGLALTAAGPRPVAVTFAGLAVEVAAATVQATAMLMGAGGAGAGYRAGVRGRAQQEREGRQHPGQHVPSRCVFAVPAVAVPHGCSAWFVTK